VLDSAITLIHNGRLYYRGRDAIALAERASVESVAAWLWNAEAGEDVWAAQPSLLTPGQLRHVRGAAADPLSAFAARCTASAGATPYDVVSTGLATLKGFRHGGAGERVLRLLDHADTAKTARESVAAALRGGDGVPGFGHPLYPAGDPRAVLLLRLAERASNRAAWRPIQHAIRAGTELVSDQPNLDFGLAAVTRAYSLPRHAPLLLFAVSRTIGWIAHAIEEYASNQLIRPRARYTGPAPASE
jgi:citrate synthase